MERIGVRELRQHASRYLERVSAGESLEVTDRGRPIAMLVPIRTGPWAQLVTSGRITSPTVEGDLLDEDPADYAINVSARLAAMRAQER